MFADPLHQYLYARYFEACRQPQVRVMRVFQAEYFLAVGAIKMHVILGMRFVGAVVPTHGKPCNPVCAYDLVHNTCFFKVIKHAVEGDPVNFAKGRFQFGMRQCLTCAGQFFQYLHSRRGCFQSFLPYLF